MAFRSAKLFKFIARWRSSKSIIGRRRKKARCRSSMLSVAGALVPAAAWEEAQEARLRRRVLRVRRLSTLLRRFWSASAADRPFPSPKKQGRATSEPVHGPALQGTVVPGKYSSPYRPRQNTWRESNQLRAVFKSLDTSDYFFLFLEKNLSMMSVQRNFR